VSQENQFRAPAGWYPDPLGLPQLRWWNNHGWTEQVSAAPEPVAVQQEARYAWMEDEPPVETAFATASDRGSVPPQTQSAPSLNQLEGPRAFSKVDEPSMWTGHQVPAAPSAPAAPAANSVYNAPQPIAAPEPAQAAASTPAPPPYWDADDDSRPAPSVLPEDLKFWPGTNPAELRRLAREQSANGFQQ
jgi:hypothetical protein